ncbi:DUF368 domain-containing protein [Desulfosediminicola sp.]|uniref:DUF368 domain-containing protein n=1 Tax=Desulfosediminicola sp. TaxID=2886825 RepID=UPI003AF2D46D
MQTLKNFSIGFLIGLANLIPGVSGGTFALILGVYERLIHFLNQLGPKSVRTLLSLISQLFRSGFTRDNRTRLWRYLQENDYPFMSILALGALVCIFSMSALMKHLLLHHFVYTYAYFFGLIIVSILVPWKMIKRRHIALILPALIGIILTVSITATVDPYQKALHKSELLQTEFIGDSTQSGQSLQQTATAPLSYVGKYSSGEFAFIFICGVLAISAMVLPGVSGSLVLILLGQYFTVISAIAGISSLLLDDISFLAAMALGIVVGLLSFARVIEYALTRFHDLTVSFLIGLIGGSLYTLWPFKRAEIIAEYYVKNGSMIEKIDNFQVYSNINILPDDLKTAMVALAIVIAGMATMIPFIRGGKA